MTRSHGCSHHAQRCNPQTVLQMTVASRQTNRVSCRQRTSRSTTHCQIGYLRSSGLSECEGVPRNVDVFPPKRTREKDVFLLGYSTRRHCWQGSGKGRATAWSGPTTRVGDLRLLGSQWLGKQESRGKRRQVVFRLTQWGPGDLHLAHAGADLEIPGISRENMSTCLHQTGHRRCCYNLAVSYPKAHRQGR